ncbi:PQQ-binding-like beta-propeller repeat protein [Glaciecola petra]|uniref:PQQ-binding-like beta-propeller repeat protein n=1 Tax=Glaciecola petra TaxID=3075602 RepID=A0ABU2ZM75_9ALTE|nr:PQQ-binding-like beta-propeller repeat protein [Aestuariibacter sp. P117]MDT0593727.1 PQQ-binding-like beta-propeller repeat protein [Aestuariibacter sp. P117]
MDKIFLGIKGHVVCLDKLTGNELWRQKLKIDWGKPTIVVYSEELFVYLGGTFYCLSPETGVVKWENRLKGLGSGSCVIAVSGKSADVEAGSAGQAAMGEIIETVVDFTT